MYNIIKIPSTLNKDSWKAFVKKKVTVKDFETLKAEAKNNCKINNIKYQNILNPLRSNPTK